MAFFPRFSLFSENLLAVISCPFICAFIPLHTKRGERGKMQKENPQNHPPKKKTPNRPKMGRGQWAVYRHSGWFSGGWCKYAYVCVVSVFMYFYVQRVPCIYVLTVFQCVWVWRDVDNNNKNKMRAMCTFVVVMRLSLTLAKK